jgi:quercetin dioxygenase-like cupin family protein
MPANLPNSPSRTPNQDHGFSCWSIEQEPTPHGITHANQPIHIHAWSDATPQQPAPLTLPADATHFGFVQRGTATLASNAGTFDLGPGMYFCVPGPASVSGPGSGQTISVANYLGLFQIGGPIEPRGRLQYIDGCSDTLLVPPPVFGDPCLNLLYLPPGTTQTAHTHPSLRAGLIAAGEGRCHTRGGQHDLLPGTAFLIEAESLHSFHTTDHALYVIAFHPDSDFGPRHDDHPMVNRTIIGGQSAARLSPAQRRIEV